MRTSPLVPPSCCLWPIVRNKVHRDIFSALTPNQILLVIRLYFGVNVFILTIHICIVVLPGLREAQCLPCHICYLLGVLCLGLADITHFNGELQNDCMIIVVL